MFDTKLKIAAALVLSVSVLGSGRGLLLQYAYCTSEGLPAKSAANEGESKKLAKEQAIPAKEQAAVAEAEAVLKLKETNLARSAQAYKQGAGSKADYDQAIAEVDVARAQLAKAKATLDAARAALEQPAAQPEKVLPIDPRIAEAELRQQEANVEIALAKLKLKQTDAARIEELVKRGVAAKEEIDRARGEVKVAEAEVKQAQAGLDRAKVILDQAKNPVKKAPAISVIGQDKSLTEGEAKLERLLKLQAEGVVSESEVIRARIELAQARIASELRAIVELRQLELTRAQKLFEAKVLTDDELKKANEALDAAKKRLAEWK